MHTRVELVTAAVVVVTEAVLSINACFVSGAAAADLYTFICFEFRLTGALWPFRSVRVILNLFE